MENLTREEKISKAIKEKWAKDKEYREKMKKRWLGKYHREATKIKMSEIRKKWWKKYPLSEEEKKKRGEFLKTVSRAKERGPKHPGWKGGKYKDSRSGYMMVYYPGHPAYERKNSYIPEHRLVMEKILNRYLNPNEEVHHINGIKDDNRPENLKLVVKKMHFSEVECPYCRKKFEVK